MKSQDSSEEIIVNVNLGGNDVEMELDTGAAHTLMPLQQFKKLFPLMKLKKTDVLLKSYSGDIIHVHDQAIVDVKHNKQQLQLPILVVDSKGPALFGRNWLRKLKLNWSVIKSVHVGKKPNLESVLNAYERCLKINWAL